MNAPAGLNPDRLRRLDLWLGSPICFVLTIVSRLSSLFTGRTPPDGPPRNVLLIELAEMGSMVLACPAVYRLRSVYPDCRIFFLLFEHIDESVKVMKIVPDAHVMTIDVANAFTIARDTVRFMREARRQRIDTAINLEFFGRFSTFLSYVSGAARRVGFHRFTEEGRYTGDLYTHRVIYNPHLHAWQSMLTLVKALDAAPNELPLGKFRIGQPGERVVPKVVSDAAARQRIHDLIDRERPGVAGKRLIVINPNASKLIAIRKWPLERYAALTARLLEDPRNACVITGVASEREDARFIVERVKNDRLVDLAGKTSLVELIDLFNVADLLVTNDSGPAHFAALTDIHIVVFFGPETPRLYAPLSERCTVMYADYACSPCVSAYNQRRSVCANNRCLQEISVDEAYGRIAALLRA